MATVIEEEKKTRKPAPVVNRPFGQALFDNAYKAPTRPPPPGLLDVLGTTFNGPSVPPKPGAAPGFLDVMRTTFNGPSVPPRPQADAPPASVPDRQRVLPPLSASPSQTFVPTAATLPGEAAPRYFDTKKNAAAAQAKAAAVPVVGVQGVAPATQTEQEKAQPKEKAQPQQKDAKPAGGVEVIRGTQVGLEQPVAQIERGGAGAADAFRAQNMERLMQDAQRAGTWNPAFNDYLRYQDERNGRNTNSAASINAQAALLNAQAAFAKAQRGDSNSSFKAISLGMGETPYIYDERTGQVAPGAFPGQVGALPRLPGVGVGVPSVAGSPQPSQQAIPMPDSKGSIRWGVLVDGMWIDYMTGEAIQ